MTLGPGEFLERFRGRLAEGHPGMVAWQEPEGARTRLIFPAEPPSDYRFVALVPHRLERVILQAELVRDADLRFWRHTVARGHGGAAALADEAADLLGPLLARPSRIRQHRGLFTWSFSLEPQEGDRPPLRGVRRPRWLSRVPPAPGGEAVYRAEPARRRR